MTSLTAEPTTPTLGAPSRPGVLRSLAEFGSLTAAAVRAARAYQHAGTVAARRRVLDEFASGAQRAA